MANYSLSPAKPRKDHQYLISGDVVGLNIATAFFLTSVQRGARWLPALGAAPQLCPRRWLGQALDLVLTSPLSSMHVFYLVQRRALTHAFDCRCLQVWSEAGAAGCYPVGITW